MQQQYAEDQILVSNRSKCCHMQGANIKVSSAGKARDIDVGCKHSYHEQEIFATMKKAFLGENIKEQHAVQLHRVDAHFPEHSMILECDEKGHSSSIRRAKHGTPPSSSRNYAAQRFYAIILMPRTLMCSM